MDRIYYYDKMAKQREHEISQEAAAHRLFNDSNERSVTAQQAKRTLLIFAPLVILLLYYLG